LDDIEPGPAFGLRRASSRPWADTSSARIARLGQPVHGRLGLLPRRIPGLKRTVRRLATFGQGQRRVGFGCLSGAASVGQ